MILVEMICDYLNIIPISYKFIRINFKQLFIFIHMSNQLIEEGSIIYKTLTNQCILNISRVTQIKDLASNLSRKFNEMANELKKQSRYFFNKLKEDRFQNEGIVFLNQYVGDMIREISNSMSKISNQINIHVLEPISHFLLNFQETNDRISKKSLNYITQIQEISYNLQIMQKSYKDAVARTKNRKQSAEQLMDHEAIFREQININNNMWRGLQLKYKKLLQQFELGNESRCVFTKNLEIKLVRILNSILNSEDTQLSIKKYENYPYVNQLIEQKIAQKVQSQLGKPSHILYQPIFYQFTYNITNNIQQQQVYTKKMVQNFINSLINKDFKSSNQFEGLRTTIIQNKVYSQTFLKYFADKLQNPIQLPLDKYHQILAILKFLFATLIQGQINTIDLYNLLQISLYIHTQNNHLIKQLSKYHDFLKNQQIWYKLFHYLKDKRKQKLKINAPISPTPTRYLKKIYTNYAPEVISKGIKKLGARFNLPNFEDKSDDIQEQINFEALRQINNFISKLDFGSEFIFDLLEKFTKKQKLSQRCIQKLVKYHYFTCRDDLDKLFFNAHKIKSRREQKMSGQIFDKVILCIRLTLKFLPLQANIWKLLLVNKKWNQKLKKPILQRYLKFQTNLHKIQKCRINLYLKLAKPRYLKQFYNKMLKEVPKQHQYTDIIGLDVKRSCNSNPQRQPYLFEMLQTFSFYNEQIGYLQGMNYLGEQILKLKCQQHQSYNIFEYILQNHFNSIFTHSFENLKLKIYQFYRLFEKYLPNLYRHFEKQKIEGEHFLVSWAITLWGEFQGDIVWIMWDGFIIDGWKWWIKVCLWVLKILESQLLTLNFEQILKYFSETSTNYLLGKKIQELEQFGIRGQQIRIEINKFKVTNSMLVAIQKQYIYSIKKACDIVKR